MSIINDGKITNYINDVCSHIKYKECHNEIQQELNCHIEDVYDEYISRGDSPNIAIDKAIKRMGSSTEIGEKLNMVHKGSPDWITLILTLILINSGIVFMYFIKSNNLLEDSNNLFYNTLKTSILGTLLIIFLFYFDYRKLQKYSYHLFWLSLTFTFICTYIIHNITPSSTLLYGSTFRELLSITPYLFIISLCGIFNKINLKEPHSLIKLFFIFIMPVILFVKLECLSLLLIYLVGFIVLLLSIKIKIRFIIGFISIISLTLSSFFFMSTYRMYRLKGLLHFKNDPTGVGYQNNIMQNALNSTPLLGNGFCKTDLFLADGHKELALNYITYSLGWIALFIIICLFIALIIRLLTIKKFIINSYGKMLILGISSIFIFKIICNILMNLNLFPITGLSMPFISYGVPENLFNMISIGLILSVYRRRSLSLPI